jgi:hypothetical protein
VAQVVVLAEEAEQIAAAEEDRSRGASADKARLLAEVRAEARDEGAGRDAAAAGPALTPLT